MLPAHHQQPPGSPTSPSHKRHILHEDRDIHEIKRRMGGLRFGEDSTEAVGGLGLAGAGGPAASLFSLASSSFIPSTSISSFGVPPGFPSAALPGAGCTTTSTADVPAAAIPPPFPSPPSSNSVNPSTTFGVFPPFPPASMPGGDYPTLGDGTTVGGVPAFSATPAPATEEEAEAMDSGDEQEEEDAGMLGASASSTSSGLSRSSSSSSNASSVSRIEPDDPRSVMLSLLYKRRPPRDKVEAKIENLIRFSLLRAKPGVGPPPLQQPLSLCDKPWPLVGGGNDNGGMESSPDVEVEGGMDL